MAEAARDIETTPYLVIFGDILAGAECGLLCHNRDLDHFPTGVLKKYSASAEMAIPVLVRLMAVALSKYPNARDCNSVAKKERQAIETALRALEASAV
jgi:hypothetical protein